MAYFVSVNIFRTNRGQRLRSRQEIPQGDYKSWGRQCLGKINVLWIKKFRQITTSERWKCFSNKNKHSHRTNQPTNRKLHVELKFLLQTHNHTDTHTHTPKHIQKYGEAYLVPSLFCIDVGISLTAVHLSARGYHQMIQISSGSSEVFYKAFTSISFASVVVLHLLYPHTHTHTLIHNTQPTSSKIEQEMKGNNSSGQLKFFHNISIEKQDKGNQHDEYKRSNTKHTNRTHAHTQILIFQADRQTQVEKEIEPHALCLL